MKDKSHFSIIGSGGGLDETPRDEITFDWTNMRVKNTKKKGKNKKKRI